MTSYFDRLDGVVEDDGNPLGRDHQFWSGEVDKSPHLPIRLRVAQDCTTHWMLWEALQCSEGMTHSPSKLSFVDRYGRYWLLQAMYFTTRKQLKRYLGMDNTDKWWATANVVDLGEGE